MDRLVGLRVLALAQKRGRGSETAAGCVELQPAVELRTRQSEDVPIQCLCAVWLK